MSNRETVLRAAAGLGLVSQERDFLLTWHQTSNALLTLGRSLPPLGRTWRSGGEPKPRRAVCVAESSNRFASTALGGFKSNSSAWVVPKQQTHKGLDCSGRPFAALLSKVFLSLEQPLRVCCSFHHYFFFPLEPSGPSTTLFSCSLTTCFVCNVRCTHRQLQPC